jgi:O-antigen/teichoic acid export membrane protein
LNNIAGRFLPLIRTALKNFKDVALYLAANVVGAVISYFTLPFFTNHLTVEDFGIWGYVITANAFLTPFLALDLHSYYLVEYYKPEQVERRPQIFNSLISFSFLWTIAFILLSFFVGTLIFQVLGINIDFHPFMSITILSNLTNAFFVFLLLQYRLERSSVKYSILTILQTLLSVGIPILFILYYKSTVISRISGYSLGLIILGTYCFLILKLKYNFHFEINKEIIRKGLWFSSPLIPYSLAIFLFDFLDRYFLEKSLSLTELGYYSLAFQFTSLLSVFFIALLRVFEPDIMKWIHQDQHAKFSRFFTFYLLILAFISITFSLAGPTLLSLVTNPRFQHAGLLSVNLISAFYFKSVLLLLLTILVSYSKTRIQMIMMLGAVLIFSGLGHFVANTFHIKGLILLKTGIYFAMCLAAFYYVQKKLDIKIQMALATILGFLIITYCNYFK